MYEKIVDLLMDHMGLKKEKISSDSSLTLELGLDSYDLIGMCVVLEDAFDIVIDEQEIANLHTVMDVFQCVVRKCNQKREATEGTSIATI
jgi:acyl carrier protein